MPFGSDLPPSLRGGTGGRHRGPRRPAMFRAAVPVAAVLAAGGGALGLVHATGSGAPESQAMDSSSRSVDSAVTTNLANAPAGVDNGDTSGSTTLADPASAAFGDSTPATSAHTTGGDTGAKPGVPVGKTSTPGTSSPVGGAAPSSAPGAPGIATTSPAANGPVQISTPPLPGTPATSQPSAPITSQPPPTATPPDKPSDPGSPPPPSTPTTPPSGATTPPPDSSSAPGSPTSTPTPSPTPTPTNPTPTPTGTTTGNSPGTSQTPRVLQSGDTGPEVANLQTQLDRLGTPTWVPITGVYDTRTAEAVAYVQNKLDITDDPRGVCGSTTAAAISALSPR